MTVTASHRLPAQPGEVIDRTRSLRFTWNGRGVAAHPSDSAVTTVAAAADLAELRLLFSEEALTHQALRTAADATPATPPSSRRRAPARPAAAAGRRTGS